MEELLVKSARVSLRGSTSGVWLLEKDVRELFDVSELVVTW